MDKEKDLLGVAHNIAHHAASGLSFLSPHLAETLRSVNIDTTEIDLMVSQPYPPVSVDNKSLKPALTELHHFAFTLLKRHGFSKDQIDSLVLYATPAPWDEDGYSLHTRVVISSSNGRNFDSGWLQ